MGLGAATGEDTTDAGEFAATLGAATGGFSSSFARVELFLQPASKRGRTNESARIRRCIPITKAGDYHVLKNYKARSRVFLSNHLSAPNSSKLRGDLAKSRNR